MEGTSDRVRLRSFLPRGYPSKSSIDMAAANSGMAVTQARMKAGRCIMACVAAVAVG